MKRILLFFSLFFYLIILKAQTVTFNSSIPGNWSTSGTTTISLSNAHYKDGSNSLKWTATNNQVLTASSLGITSTQTGSSVNSTTHFYIYSEAESLDTLVVEFLENATVRRTGRVLLNFKGWRDYHRNLVTDYGQGNARPGFALTSVRFTFKKSGTGSNDIWIDNLDWVGDTDSRYPGPHMALDEAQFLVTASLSGGLPLDSWLNTPDIAATTPSSTEISSITTLKSRYPTSNSTITSAELTEATAYYGYCNISETNNIIIGRGLLSVTDQDTLAKLANYCRIFYRSGTTSSLSKLNLFTKYILDQGVAEGGRNVMATNSYTNARSFTDDFLEALPAYTGTLREDVIKMLKWSNEYNKIYINQFLVRNNTDFVHIKLAHIIRIALASTDNAEVARDLKCIARFLKLAIEPGDGGRDGLKPDGLGFHHESKYLHYMYAYATWIDHAFNLRGTPFKISLEAYNNMLTAVKTLILETNLGVVRANSTSGRFPFSQSVVVKSSDFRDLVTVGGDISSSLDSEAKSLYNYFYKTQYYAGVPQINLDGFHQFNYGAMGVKRNKNWVAVAKGLTDKMFGAEIYASANRYGRYQGYGALDILYASEAATGYISEGDGWDWNIMPGTTSVHLSNYTSLRPPTNSNRDEYQAKSFAGALSAGNDGIFAMDFVQDPAGRYNTNNLTFRKSIFAFDSIFVCLGSKINGSGGNVATNLFQSIHSSTNPSIFINSSTATTSNINTSLATTSSNWIVNGQTTGFFIPSGNNQVQVFRGSQTTPINTDNTAATTATANASKAFINHGISPSNASYQYVTVPGTTPAKMQALADSINEGKVYEVLANTLKYHAVKYIPTKITGYSFFESASDINLGYIDNVSNNCLITIKELGDTLIVRIANPDLNTVPNSQPTVDWLSSPSNVSIILSQRWRFLQSSSPSTINTVSNTNLINSIKLDFVLDKGNYTEVKLVKDQTQMGYGVWNFNEKVWAYDLSTATSSSETAFSTASTSSVSDSITYGFLPYPPYPSKARVSLGSSGNGSFNRIGSGDNKKIRIFANSASLNKFSVYDIGDKPVVSTFLTLIFGADGTNGNWMLGLGNNAASTIFTSSSNLNSTTYTNGIFSAFRFDLGSTNNISFKYRKVVNSVPSFVEIDNITFIKGTESFLELYSNNSNNSSSYTRNSINYTVSAQCYHLWVNGVKISITGIGDNIPSTELAANENINSFFITSTSNTLPTASSATLTLADLQMRYENPQANNLSVNLLNFEPKLNASEGLVDLVWSTSSEANTDYYELSKSKDGVNFSEFSKVKGSINSNQPLQYKVVDKYPFYGKSYYQLVEVDTNGKRTSLSIKGIDYNLPFSTKLQIYPNPASGKLTANFYSENSKTVTISVTNLLGAVCLTKSSIIKEGINQIVLDIQSLKQGVFILNIDNQKVKFIKE